MPWLNIINQVRRDKEHLNCNIPVVLTMQRVNEYTALSTIRPANKDTSAYVPSNTFFAGAAGDKMLPLSFCAILAYGKINT